MIKRPLILTLAAALCFTGYVQVSYAQLNNKPYNFSSRSGGGLGMSNAGRQAIINEELFGSTPRQIVVDPAGNIADLTEGPGRSALISRQGTGSFLPGYKGTSYKGSFEDQMGVGVFNNFFAPNTSKSSGVNFSSHHSGALINTWTGRVVSGGAPVTYRPQNSIDSWTGIVFSD